MLFSIRVKDILYPLLFRLYAIVSYASIVRKTMRKYDIVIIRLDSIGDFIIGLDGMRAFLEKFKEKRILYICTSTTEELARNSKLFTDVMVVEGNFQGSLKYALGITRRFNKIKADYVFNPTWSRLPPSDLIAHSIKSKNKYCCLSSEMLKTDREKGTKYYSKIIQRPPFLSEFLNNQFFINNTIDPSFKAQLPRLDMIYKRENPIILGEYALIGISAQYLLRIWPMERLATILDNIPEKYKLVVMGYNKTDKKNADKLCSLVKIPKRIINMVGKTTVSDMFNLISNASFVIGMDSAPVHIAAAARVRSICIAHGAHYKRFIPYPKELGEVEFHPRAVYKYKECFSCGYNCVQMRLDWNKPLPCLLDVTTDMVNTELSNLLEEL